MNSFATSQLTTTQNSVQVKKSFNRCINYKLYNDIQNQKEKIRLAIDSYPYLDNISNYIRKSKNFYNKNFDHLKKISDFNQFDGITYKKHEL